jgi:hypothetical protein
MGDSGAPIHQSPTMATVVAIHSSPDDLDALHDAGKLVEPLMKRRGTTIRVRGELADRIG